MNLQSKLAVLAAVLALGCATLAYGAECTGDSCELPPAKTSADGSKDAGHNLRQE